MTIKKLLLFVVTAITVSMGVVLSFAIVTDPQICNIGNLLIGVGIASFICVCMDTFEETRLITTERDKADVKIKSAYVAGVDIGRKEVETELQDVLDANIGEDPRVILGSIIITLRGKQDEKIRD